MELYHRTFSALSNTELYDIMVLRQEVFVVEQECPYLDADGKDPDSLHVIGTRDGELIAYTRICPPGLSYDDHASIGRVANKISLRGQGIGKKLMEYSIKLTQNTYPGKAIKISAQVYILGFYEALGFVVQGEEYLEDDIPHMAMIMAAETAS